MEFDFSKLKSSDKRGLLRLRHWIEAKKNKVAFSLVSGGIHYEDISQTQLNLLEKIGAVPTILFVSEYIDGLHVDMITFGETYEIAWAEFCKDVNLIFPMFHDEDIELPEEFNVWETGFNNLKADLEKNHKVELPTFAFKYRSLEEYENYINENVLALTTLVDRKQQVN